MANTRDRSILVRALGDCVIETPISTLTPNQDIVFAAALFFVFNRHRKITRDSIEHVIWPELEQSSRAHHRLRQTILKLKEAGFPIIRDNGFLASKLPIVADFDQFVASARDKTYGNLPASFELLPGYVPRISTPYAHWVDEKRMEVNAALVRVLLGHIHHARDRGEWEQVEALTKSCGVIDPYNEEAVLARAEAIALRGAKLEALALLDDYVAELGDAPSDMRLPATLMRRRISERRDQTPYEAREIGLLGRAIELAALNSALEATNSGRGQCCVIEAEIGMGKSRLLSEFADFAHLKGAAVRYSQSHASDQTRPLSVLIELVPGLRKVRGAIGCSPESLECLNRLTIEGSRNAILARTEASLIAENILDAIMDLLDAVSEEQTVILIIDDAQWMDQPSLNVFQRIVPWLQQRRVMVIFAVRVPSASFHLSEEFPSGKLIRLPALTRELSATLIGVLLRQRTRQASDKTVNWFVDIGEGNPFFLKELVGQWQETGRQDESPASLVAIANQRLLGLSRHALQILQTCAILGRFSSIARLEQILEFKTFELFEGLNELGKCSMVRVDKLSGESASEPRITCSNDLIGTAALRLLSPPAELAMHRRVGLMLERETRDHYSPSIIAESALHWEKAGDAKQALRLTTSYADHLMGIGFPSEAIQTYRKALGFCSTQDQKADVLTQLIGALYAAGEWKEVGESIAELNKNRVRAVKVSDEHSQIELIGFEAKWRSSNQWSDLFRQVKRCIFAESATAEHRVRAAVLGLKLATNVGTGEELDQIYSAVEGFLENPQIDSRARLYVEMVYHTDRGDMERGKLAAMSLVEHDRESGNSANLIWSLVNAAQALRRYGGLVASSQYLQEAFEIATKKNLSTRARTVAHHLILTALAQDDIVLARKWLNVARDFPNPRDDLHTRHELFYYGARIALKECNVRESIKLCDQISSDADQSLLRRISLLALRVRLGVESRHSIHLVGQLLPELIALYEVECARGGQDFEAFSLYLGRQYIGEGVMALKQLEDYVKIFRRERGAPPQEMVSVLLIHARTAD